MVIIYLLLGYLLTDTSVLCTASLCCNGTNPQCKKGDVAITTTPSSPQEGDDVYLTCNISCVDLNGTFVWKKNEEVLQGENNSTLVLKNVVIGNNGNYVCSVACCESDPYTLAMNSSPVILLLICGISALALVLILGLIMKCKLKRDNEKHKERMRQRVQAGQAGGAFPATPRGT